MNKTRLEAFSDGVLAIIITIMVLELKVPHTADWEVLKELIPVLISYMISFLFIGIYWGNHHHLLHTVKKVSSGMMLANLHLLFWLSLLPFATGWMGENHFAPNTIVVYSFICLLAGFAYSILQKIILAFSDPHDKLTIAIKQQTPKIIISTVCSFLVLLVILSATWLVPDKNIERALNER